MTSHFLFIDINCTHICPTRALFLPSMRMEHDITPYGPGYVGDEILEKGLEAFIAANGPFDALIIAPPISMYGLPPYTVDQNFYRKFLACSGTKNSLSYLPQILLDVQRAKLPRIGLFFESDLYDLRSTHIEQLKSTAEYYIGLGPDLWKPISEMPDIPREHFGHIASDDYWNFIKDKAHLFASLPQHYVAETEFFYGPLSQRKLDWSVIGMNYVARREAAAKLREMGVSLTENAVIARTYGRLKRFNIIPHELQIMQVLLNHNFRKRLESSKYGFTCGLPWDMPIRKFFEIPASGGVLVCKPCNGFEAIGFEHGVNAFKARPDDLPEIHEFLTKNPDEAQKIATRGQKLMFEQHSLHARGRQLGAVLSAIANGTFKGAKFEGGEFVI